MRQANETKKANTNEHTTMHHQFITGPISTKTNKTSFIRQNWAEKKGPKHIQTLRSIVHLMQPQQFIVKATWTQVLPPGRPGTFLHCLRSHSTVFVNHVFPTSSTAAVVSLSWPLGGGYDRKYTDNNRMRNKFKHSTTKENEIQTKK